MFLMPGTLAAQLQSAASSPAAGGMWSRDSSGWGAAFVPGANEAALRTQAALSLGVDGMPQVGTCPACLGFYTLVDRPLQPCACRV